MFVYEELTMNKHIYTFKCADMTEVLDTMKMFRFGFKTLGGFEVEGVSGHDGSPGCIAEETLAPSGPGAVEYRFAGGASVVISPSATEPEISVRVMVAGDDPDVSEMIDKHILEDIANIVNMNSRMGYCCE